MPLQATSGAASYDAFGGGAAAVPAYIEDVFSTWLYTGNGVNSSSTQTITNNIDLSTKGGMIWMKDRTTTESPTLADSARGISGSYYKGLFSNNTNGNGNSDVRTFTTTGFTLGRNSGTGNANGDAIASWTFRKQPKFFDVLTYTGTGSNTTVAHNLGSVPACIIVKRTDTTGDWQVYHRSLANTEYIVLNTTAAKATGATRWNITTPTSTVFSLGTDATVNASGGTYVAYIFAHDAGGFGLTGTDNVISCGSYTGNGSATGPTVSLGYEPQWLMIKNTTGTGGWSMLDNMRGMVVGGPDPLVVANANTAEDPNSNQISPTATGFQIVTTSSEVNTSASTYIYIAIRRGPMKVPTLGTAVFGMSARTGTGANATVTGGGGGVTDLTIIKNRGTFDPNLYTARLIGAYYTSVSDTMVETQNAVVLQDNPWDVMSGIKVGTTSTLTNASSNTFINYLFTRAPTVFDVVCFKGSATAQTVAHNLGAVPQLIICIKRSVAGNVACYSATLGATKYMRLNSDGAVLTSSSPWNNTAPTSSVFTTSDFFEPSSTTVIAFLFATLAGVSKVGSYTGNGSTQTIDCGFGAGGARFVLIKRTDATGNWYVYDTARGMTALTDPYFLMDTNAGDVATLGSVTTVSTGFALNSAILAAINVNAGTYIFLAIA
jgi:hypothetical protein